MLAKPVASRFRMIMEMVGNHSFILTTIKGKRSRLRRLKDGVTQGSALAHHHINVYISDLPNIASKKYANADAALAPHHINVYVCDLPNIVSKMYANANDLVIMHADGDWQVMEVVLSKDISTVSVYLQT